ncbi:MAG: efflux RND transporter periplasmic adaptor subunit [Hyphomicrobiales bacterium]
MNRPPLHLALALATATALAASGCSHGGAETGGADRPVPVRVEPVSLGKVAVPVTAAGTLGPKDDIALSFKVGGVVARVLVDEGQTVRAGQLLASLDMGDVDPAVTRARAGADKADRDYARAQRLFADSVATLAQVEDAETARDAARAALDAAEFNRRHAEIVAPSGGVILRRQAEPGELVESGSTVLVLGSRARGQVVRAWLADRDVVRIRRGDPAVARFDAFPGREFHGHVREIAAAADPMTGTYRVEVALDGGAGVGLAPGAGRGADAARGAPLLASGLVGTVEIRPAADQTVALVPADAVLEANGASGIVYTLAGDGRTAVRRPVTIAYLDGDRIAIASGLSGTSRVITSGAAYLDDGRRVEVRP